MQHLTQLGVLPFDNVLSAFLVLAMVNSTLRTSLSATWSGCSFASLLNVDFLFNGFFDHLSNQEVWPIWTKRWSEPTYWPYCCWKRKNVLMFHFSLSIRLVSCGFYAYIWGGEDVSFIQDMWQQRFTVSTVILKYLLNSGLLAEVFEGCSFDAAPVWLNTTKICLIADWQSWLTDSDKISKRLFWIDN